MDGKLPTGLDGFIAALAGWALIASALHELIEPTTDATPLRADAICVLIGANSIAFLKPTVKTNLDSDSGGGPLAAITEARGWMRR